MKISKWFSILIRRRYIFRQTYLTVVVLVFLPQNTRWRKKPLKVSGSRPRANKVSDLRVFVVFTHRLPAWVGKLWYTTVLEDSAWRLTNTVAFLAPVMDPGACVLCIKRKKSQVYCKNIQWLDIHVSGRHCSLQRYCHILHHGWEVQLWI